MLPCCAVSPLSWCLQYVKKSDVPVDSPGTLSETIVYTNGTPGRACAAHTPDSSAQRVADGLQS